MPFAIKKKLKIIWNISKLIIDASPTINFQKPIRNKNHYMGLFDSSNEAPGSTDYNAKNLNSF